ncbi:MAG: class II aldolase/adducin family protein [Aigarchaeota archaeon]|nr:class II aldolase/adducin family protein [Aigarchaeota archaeon]MDW8092820.1 class II aldolase/adducin family protein [Nitrososphaerota archaeon]
MVEADHSLKVKLAMANRMLVNEGLTEMGRGHVCYYLGEGRILVPAHLHAYGRTISDCNEEDLVVIDLEGNVLEGKYRESMGEIHFYTELFRVRDDVRAAAHLHPLYTNILVMAGKSLLPISRDSFLFIDGLPVYEGLPLYIKDRVMGRELVERLGKRRAIVHRGHGAFVVGRTIEEVVITAAALERASKKQYYASLLGDPLTYNEEEVRRTYTEDIYRETTSVDWSYYLKRLMV